jgi:predicted pyridoxine 5'-phosphate oxidase superfamily flavin-nucleotide-binding protein
MDTFEYGVLTLSFEQKEIEIGEQNRKTCLEYAKRKGYQPEYVDQLKRFKWSEVLIAKSFDTSGKEHEILRDYTGENGFTTVEYPRKGGANQIVLSSKSVSEDVWDNNYPITALAGCLTKLGSEGWEVVEYKFNSAGLGFAQALLKRKVQKKK